MSKRWTFKKSEVCDSLEKSSAHMLFEFERQTDKGLLHPPAPGLAAIFHNSMMIQQL